MDSNDASKLSMSSFLDFRLLLRSYFLSLFTGVVSATGHSFAELFSRCTKRAPVLVSAYLQLLCSLGRKCVSVRAVVISSHSRIYWFAVLYGFPWCSQRRMTAQKYICFFFRSLEMSGQSGVQCCLSKPILHVSNMLSNSCVLGVQ